MNNSSQPNYLAFHASVLIGGDSENLV